MWGIRPGTAVGIDLGDPNVEHADSHICYEYKFEGHWPTSSPTDAPIESGAVAGVKLSDVLVSAEITFENLAQGLPIISDSTGASDCHTDDFISAYGSALDRVVTELLFVQQDLQTELHGATTTLEGPCQFESIFHVTVTEFCSEESGTCAQAYDLGQENESGNGLLGKMRDEGINTSFLRFVSALVDENFEVSPSSRRVDLPQITGETDFYDFVGFGKCVDTHDRQYQALDASSQETDTISVGACAQFCHNSYMASGDFSVGFEIEVDDSEGKLCRCLVSAFPDERRLTESEEAPHTGSARELFYGTHDESDPPVSADGVSFLFLISLVLTYTNAHIHDVTTKLPTSFTTTYERVDHEQIGGEDRPVTVSKEFSWEPFNKCVLGSNIDVRDDLTYTECANRCLECRDTACNENRTSWRCVGIEWHRETNECSLKASSKRRGCANRSVQVTFYEFREITEMPTKFPTRPPVPVHVLRLGRSGVCVFVESGRTDGLAPRDGGFPTALMDLGFVHYTRTDGFLWYSTSTVADWFCIGTDDAVAFPSTTTTDTVHGICTFMESGTAFGQAYSSPDGLSYEAVDISSLDVHNGITGIWDSRCLAKYCYDMELHYNHQGRSRPAQGAYYPHATVNFGFEQCRSRCERVASANPGNTYLGLDLKPGIADEGRSENLCYCLFDSQPTCPEDLPNCQETSSVTDEVDSTICVMTVNYRHYPDKAAIVASWRQSLEADGFTRLEDIGDEEELSSLLCLWPNWGDQDYYCHYRLTMHCKHNAGPAILELDDVVSVAVNHVDSTICVMSVDKRHYPDQAAIVNSWRQSLEADGFIRQDDTDSEELCLWPNWEDQDYYCHYRLATHCKYYATRATLPPVPENPPGVTQTMFIGVCAYGSDVHTAAGAIEGNSFNPIPSSDIDEHQIFFSDNPYWDLVGFESTPCNNGGIFLRASAMLGPGGVASVTVNPVDTAGQILHYPLQDCAGSSAEDSFCYDMTHHLNNDSGSSQPFLTDHYTRLGADFDSCSVLCERLADYVSNVDNPYRGVDVDMNSNRCYCLFDARPTCPQFPLASCFPWEGADDGAGPVSHLRGEPGTYPFPVIGTSSDLERLWDGTVSADSGVCVFIAGHQRGQWGPDLESLGWIDEGFPDGFGYPDQLALYCQYNVASARLPPFHDFTIDNPDATWGIRHGLCT
ncbi:hypothetical protein THAOC_19581, partial [Thalassiosira oceanica]